MELRGNYCYYSGVPRSLGYMHRDARRLCGPTLGVYGMHTKRRVARLLAAAAMAIIMAGGGAAVTATPALAAPTYCKTLNLSGDLLGLTIRPHMSVGICYNGSRVWQHGGITPGVSTWGYYVPGFDWYGTYGSGGWLGVGENFSATAWTNFATFYCAPRWGINAWGNVTSYSRNC